MESEVDQPCDNCPEDHGNCDHDPDGRARGPIIFCHIITNLIRGAFKIWLMASGMDICVVSRRSVIKNMCRIERFFHGPPDWKIIVARQLLHGWRVIINRKD